MRTRAATLATALILLAAATAARAEVTGEEVKAAIQKAVTALKKLQRVDGSWSDQYFPGGETSLVTLALLHAGESPTSPAMSAALERISHVADQFVYVVSLKLMALIRGNPSRYERQVRDSTRWLIAAQNASGLWNYTEAGARFDHSVSQFALLGLHTASQAGLPVPQNVWKSAVELVVSTQQRDGGWAYQADGKSYGSMTAAGVADLLILGANLNIGRERDFRNGIAPGCGSYKTSKPLMSGLAWLARNFRADSNPISGAEHHYYWLYGVERVGILSGQRFLGRHDWYRTGAEYLVKHQDRDGLWRGNLVDTSFALLFLAKGHRPLLVQKLQWSDDDAWNLDRNDLDHLTEFLGDKLGEPVAWQTVRFEAPLEEWLAAPLLYMQGHAFPNWTAAHRAKIRAFIEQGGTLLVEACCGREQFVTGFRRFAADAFPETPLRPLPPEHAVYHALYEIGPYELEGLEIGCRTSVIFSPNDLSCLWEQAKVPILSEKAFKIGGNIAAYASGRQPLRDRLDTVVVPKSATEPRGEDPPALPPGDPVRFAQLVYDGDWRPDPLALVKLAEFLRDQTRLDVITQYRALRLTEPELAQSPLLFMTGHFAFRFSPDERAALAAHLRRGGFLLAEACCGRAEFDASFRALVADTFPGATLEKLPADHPIFGGRPGFELAEVAYRDAEASGGAQRRAPELWGLALDGRLVLVHSPYALGCGWDGHVCYNCRGLISDDARRLGANVVLYALTH